MIPPAQSPGAGLDLSAEARAVLDESRAQWEIVDAHIREFVPVSARGMLPSVRLLAACIYVIDQVVDTAPELPSLDNVRSGFLPWLGDRAAKVEFSKGISELIRLVDHALETAPSHWRRHWRRAGESMVAAMWQERKWSASAQPVSLTVYLENGANSISTGWVAASVACGLQPPPPAEALKPFAQASHSVARALRLANDLASFEREACEAVINAVVVGQRRDPATAPMSERAAVELVQSHRQREMIGASHLVAESLAPWPELRDSLDALLRVVGGHWSKTDYAHPDP